MAKKDRQDTVPSPEGAALTTAPATALAKVADEDTGFEGITANELAIPFWVVLQKNSPQCEEDNPKFIDGARPGMIMNTVTGELIDGKEQGLLVVPVLREERYIEWIPRDDGGGLVDVHDPAGELVLGVLRKAPKRFGKLHLDNGNELAQTFSVYCLAIDEAGNTQPGIIAFGSTQIKKFRQWMTTAMSVARRGPDGSKQVAPLWSRRYRLRTQYEQNKKGNWYGWLIRFDGKDAAAAEVERDSELEHEAKNFRAMITSGQVRAETAGLESSAAETGVEPDDDRF